MFREIFRVSRVPMSTSDGSDVALGRLQQHIVKGERFSEIQVSNHGYLSDMGRSRRSNREALQERSGTGLTSNHPSRALQPDNSLAISNSSHGFHELHGFCMMTLVVHVESMEQPYELLRGFSA